MLSDRGNVAAVMDVPPEKAVVVALVVEADAPVVVASFPVARSVNITSRNG